MNPHDPNRPYSDESITDQITQEERDALLADLRDRPGIQRYEICPRCGGWSGGWDRCNPPNPYCCDKCQGKIDRGEPLVAGGQGRRGYNPAAGPFDVRKTAVSFAVWMLIAASVAGLAFVCGHGLAFWIGGAK